MRQIGAPRAVHVLHPYISQDEGKTAKKHLFSALPLDNNKTMVYFIATKNRIRRFLSGNKFSKTN